MGSVIQYVKDYKLILNSLIDTTPEYIFFTAQTFYEKIIYFDNTRFPLFKTIKTIIDLKNLIAELNGIYDQKHEIST